MGVNHTDWRRQPSEWPELFSTCSLPSIHPSHPGLYWKRLLRQFSFFLGPINNLICCHMIMLRPGVQLPNQLNKYFPPTPAAVNKIYKAQLTTRTERQLTSHKWRAGVRLKRTAGEIYTLKLIHWHNNHKGQLLFCSVSFHSSARRYRREGGLLEVDTWSLGSHRVSTLLLSTGRIGLDWAIKVGVPTLMSANQK